MEALLDVIQEFHTKQMCLMLDYQVKADSCFGEKLSAIAEDVSTVISELNSSVERYSHLFDFIKTSTKEDDIVAKLLLEKLEQEYNVILVTQRKLSALLRFKDTENVSIDMIYSAFKNIASLYSHNTFNNDASYKILETTMRVHADQASLFSGCLVHSDHFDHETLYIYDTTKPVEKIDQEIFKWTDEDIKKENDKIIENDKKTREGYGGIYHGCRTNWAT